ncbi:MAG TPA: hypothetical protein ENK88_04345, partial [Campylobacterales bacterium]|nr:hypothetical protein [Campylobacterales bacterium]
MNYIIISLTGMFIAYISWSLSIEFTVFSSLLFFAYFYINQRSYLFTFILSYYLFASRGLLIGTQNYYDNFYIALSFWLLASLLSTFIWIIVWSLSEKKRLFLFPLMLTLLIVPPIGFISWVNPIISSAIAFPRFGFLGIALYLVTIYIITILLIKQKSRIKLITIISILSIIAINFNQKSLSKDNINLYAINSNLTYKNKAIDFIGDYRRQKKLLAIANKSKYKNLLFHENALGNFNQNSMMIWDRLDKDKTILAGAYIYNGVGGYDNVLVELNNTTSKIIYKQRVPVPISMWKPWSEQGAKAYPFQNPIVKYKQSRVGVFICYEQLLTYTYLHTMFYEPEYIIGISNLWWVEDKSIGEIQRRSLELWG